MITYGSFSNAVSAVISEPLLFSDANKIIDLDHEYGITKDESDLVSEWADKHLGINKITGSGSQRPTWSLSDGVYFDGVANVLNGVFTWNQPGILYVVAKTPLIKHEGWIMDGGTGVTTVLITSAIETTLAMYAGKMARSSEGLVTPGEWCIWTILWNGTTSSISLNGGTAQILDPGTNNFGGLTLGASGNKNANFGKVSFKRILGRNKIDSADERLKVNNYLKAKYGIV